MGPVILVGERPRHGDQVLIGLVTITIAHTTEEYDKFVNVDEHVRSISTVAAFVYPIQTQTCGIENRDVIVVKDTQLNKLGRILLHITTVCVLELNKPHNLSDG